MAGVVGRDRRAGTSGRRALTGWSEVAERQDGVISRRQLVACGLSPGAIGALLDSRRWSGLLPGVYATFRGPLPESARLWAALLYGGDGATAAGAESLWLVSAVERLPRRLTVLGPEPRQVRSQPGVRVVRRRALAELAHPSARPRRLRVEEAVLDLAESAPCDGDAVDVVLRTTGDGLSTAARIRAALQHRPRHCRRRLLLEVLADVEEGVRSMLERRYLHDVERRHGLPPGERNAGDLLEGGRRFRDVRYRTWRLVVELDGRRHHREAFRDRSRDNTLALVGEVTLRFDWHEVADDPCAVAATVVRALRAAGWTGTPRPCGPDCPVR